METVHTAVGVETYIYIYPTWTTHSEFSFCEGENDTDRRIRRANTVGQTQLHRFKRRLLQRKASRDNLLVRAPDS